MRVARCDTVAMADRVAWLAENSADDDFLFASARFRGYIDLGPGVGDEIEDASIDEALVWARERATVVLVRLWDSDYFSAGERNPDPDRYREWPPDGLDVRPRRPRGLEALDNTEADPPALWDLRLAAHPAVDLGAFRLAVKADPRTLPAEEQPDRPQDDVRVLIRASTLKHASAIAEELTEAANEAADPGSRLRSNTKAGGGWFRRGPQVYPYAPDAPVRFGGTIRVVDEAD
jgi:hypothetical protein